LVGYSSFDVSLSWSGEELDPAIIGAVAALMFDELGQTDVASLLIGLAETEFRQAGIARVHQALGDFESWRIGGRSLGLI